METNPDLLLCGGDDYKRKEQNMTQIPMTPNEAIDRLMVMATLTPSLQERQFFCELAALIKFMDEECEILRKPRSMSEWFQLKAAENLRKSTLDLCGSQSSDTGKATLPTMGAEGL